MLPEKIMQSDLLDILFENRNKVYGAYTIRKSYNRTLIYAIGVTLFVSVLFSITQFFHHSKHHDFVIDATVTPDINLSKVPDVKSLVQPVAVKPAATHFNQKILTPPVIVNDNEETTTPTTDELDKSIIGNTNIVGSDATDVINAPASSQQGSGDIPVKPSIAKEDNSPLHFAEVMPEFPGGIKALQKFMLKNLRQPDDVQPGEKIIVRAYFVVNKDGKIEQVKIINGGRNDLNIEVERVINKMPLWKPGMQNGNAVAVYFNLPVTFINSEE